MTQFFFFFLFIIFYINITTSTLPPPPPPPPPPPSPSSSSSSYPYGFSYHIDCGTSTNSTDSFNTSWLSDRFFTGGIPALVSEPLHFHLLSEKTLRSFPPSSFGKRNCYSFPSLPSGRYLLRTFTVYDNYDAKSRPPSFDVALSATILFSWRSPWPESTARDGAYSDLFAFVPNTSSTAATDLCFYGFATDAPIVSSVELVQVDPASYDSSTTGDRLFLVNYGRISCGSDGHWGLGFTNDTDRFGRSWEPDSGFRTRPDKVYEVLTENSVTGADEEPNYFPMKVYQSAVTREGVLEYELKVDAKMDYMVWLHFAEIDSSVKRVGERVFDVFLNDNNVSRVDIYKEVGGFAAFTYHYTVKNLTTNVLTLKLVAVAGSPLISAIENYALVPIDPSTHPLQCPSLSLSLSIFIYLISFIQIYIQKFLIQISR